MVGSAPPTTSEAPPPEVEHTIARLAGHKNVKGVLILARETGILIKHAGELFAAPTAAEAPDLGRQALSRYAKAAFEMVQSVGSTVAEVEDSDELRLLRIRTRKYELLITPDPSYILVVIQDPAA